MLQLIQQTILLLGTLTGAITDTKTGYIYDWITYPMILIGIILSISQGQINNLIYAGIIFIVFFLAYKFGKLGGGDVKIFAGICLLNPYNNINFLTTTIFSAAILSMIFYSSYYTLKYAKKGINLSKNKEGIIKGAIFEIILLTYLGIMVYYQGINLEVGILLGIIFTLGIIFVALQKEIKKEFFDKKVKLKEIEEDEIISQNNNQTILKLLKGKDLIEEKEKELLRKNKITEIIVLRNLPKFGPFILLGVVIGIMYPNLIINLLF